MTTREIAVFGMGVGSGWIVATLLCTALTTLLRRPAVKTDEDAKLLQFLSSIQVNGHPAYDELKQLLAENERLTALERALYGVAEEAERREIQCSTSHSQS